MEKTKQESRYRKGVDLSKDDTKKAVLRLQHKFKRLN